jgi:pimeloyl-ACP methyl ester carboxylesterase
MIRTAAKWCGVVCLLLVAGLADLPAQKPPYDVFPPAEAPYHRVRYEASTNKGELPYAVNYTVWIPPGVKVLRGVIVHQHGCGEGSCKSGLTGAYDLHWQALARKHDCALLSPSYEQPEKADCQMWCDPRNGSDAAFQKCLVDLGAKSGHPELARVPWALWGHSGGGHWAGGMVLLHPDRVAAAWLRSGVPLLKEDPSRKGIHAHKLPDAALKVPLMCNLGTKEGVTEKGKQFAGVWPANETFFTEVRGRGGLVGVAVDPLSSHDCGNQRYLAIPWLDACLSARLPKAAGDPLRVMPADRAWLAPILGGEAVPAAKFAGEPLKAAWLPNEAIAKAWVEYVKDTKVTDATPPPAPTNLRVRSNTLTWEVEADLESGLASFVIERDGQFLADVPEQGKNPFGRPIFQNLQYSDTPAQPLAPMQFTDANAESGKKHTYRVIAVNTIGLKSKPSAASTPDEGEKEARAKLSQALTLHASFDKGLDADFSRGDKTCYVQQGKELVRAKPNEEVKLAADAGRFGGGLHFPKKGATRPSFKDDKVLGYNARSWSCTVSVWLRLNPDKDLEPGYCDPVQIIGDDNKKGYIFCEWSKDETPRYFRYAIRPLFPIWNLDNKAWADIPFEKRPMVQVERAPFSREKWTHVVFTVENLNDKTKAPLGRLYINGKLQGSIEKWDLRFEWDPAKVLLVLGAAYVGHMDDLAVFDRPLTDAEVDRLYGLKNGVRDLYPEK